MTPVPFVVRRLAPEEAPILREFLYLAIFLPPGTPPPPRSVVDHPALIGYIDAFGSRPGDHCLVAETAGQVVGAAWTRTAKDCGHGKEDTSCLAISLLPGYRGRGIGTKLLAELLEVDAEMTITMHCPCRGQTPRVISTRGPALKSWQRGTATISCCGTSPRQPKERMERWNNGCRKSGKKKSANGLPCGARNSAPI